MYLRMYMYVYVYMYDVRVCVYTYNDVVSSDVGEDERREEKKKREESKLLCSPLPPIKILHCSYLTNPIHSLYHSKSNTVNAFHNYYPYNVYIYQKTC